MPCLRELNFGIWDGKAVDEVRQIYPDSWQAWSADFVNYRIPGGENLLDVRLRVLPVIAEMVRQHYDEEVLVVAHGGVNRIILLDAMNAPLSSFYNINQSYCCHNIIDYYEDGNAVVQLLNESL
jgi:broad specificity phosphatase PhoE